MKFKNICGRAINVNGLKRMPDEEFEEENTQELKNLVMQKYLAKA